MSRKLRNAKFLHQFSQISLFCVPLVRVMQPLEWFSIKTFINTILSCDIPNTYENFNAGAEFLCSVTAGTLLKKLYMSYHAIGRN